MKAFIDTETIGFHGLPIILQYAFDDGSIDIHNFWTTPIEDSIALIDRIQACELIGFNLAFDQFHLCKMYTLLLLAAEKFGPYEYLDEHIDEVAILEEQARDGPCLKPYSAFDVMLHARTTQFQITMDRGDIRIRRVPTVLAWSLAKELDKQIVFDPILFAKRKNTLAPKFVVRDVKRPDGETDTSFKDIYLKFRPSSGLKALAVHALKISQHEIITFGDIEVPKYYQPKEYGWAPFALAIGKPGRWNGAWPDYIKYHIEHWTYNEQARKYAAKDVDYTRRLYQYFGSPNCGDDNSVLACMVAAVRWRGYAIDLDGIKELKAEAQKSIGLYPTASRAVKKYITEVLSETEQVVLAAIGAGTGKIILEEIASQKDDDCPFALLGDAEHRNCEHCNDSGKIKNLAAERAKNVLTARMAEKEIQLYDKLLLAGRLHADFNVIGALSDRMSGSGGLNTQGVNKTKAVRSKFIFAFGGLQLAGGDFSGFEVVLADAKYGDKRLRKDLLTCEKCRDVQVEYIGSKKKCLKCGGSKTLKIHALFGVHVYPDMTYDQIKATDGTADDKYTRSKSAIFTMFYGGGVFSLRTKLGVPEEVAQKALEKFEEMYRQVAVKRQEIINKFCSMRQPGGLGSKVQWHEPAEYIESLFGFRRYFTLENMICKALFDMAQAPPKEWKDIKVKVLRRDREQSAMGAVQSALYGAAFQIQNKSMKAAANHEIQSSGAQITKHLQRRIWDIQPSGCNPWLVQPVNIHDAVLNPAHPSVKDQVKQTVETVIEEFRPKVPLIEMEWGDMKNWADK